MESTILYLVQLTVQLFFVVEWIGFCWGRCDDRLWELHAGVLQHCHSLRWMLMGSCNVSAGLRLIGSMDGVWSL